MNKESRNNSSAAMGFNELNVVSPPSELPNLSALSAQTITVKMRNLYKTDTESLPG